MNIKTNLLEEYVSYVDITKDRYKKIIDNHNYTFIFTNYNYNYTIYSSI